MPRHRALAALAALAALLGLTSLAHADDFRIAEVRALPAPAALKPHIVAFTDHHDDELADPVTGLIAFEEWARSRPLHKQFLSPYPSYAEPMVTVTLNGVAKPVKEKLHIYEAEA